MRNEKTCALDGCPLLGRGDCNFFKAAVAVVQSSCWTVKVRLKRTELAVSEMCFVLRTLIRRSTNRFAETEDCLHGFRRWQERNIPGGVQQSLTPGHCACSNDERRDLWR